MNLIEIKEDVFDIACRLREIDENYRLFFNTDHKRYEIYSRAGLEVVVPYTFLDVRTLVHVRKTRLSNRKQLIEEIENTNARIEEEQRQKIIEKALIAYEEQICK
ncbi:MAG: hypothetical protein PHE93_00810 [Clostridia bacterium]|nr:hypothetical protein [Clostridia bacterium]